MTERWRSEGIGMEVGEGDGERDEERRVREARSRRRWERWKERRGKKER